MRGRATGMAAFALLLFLAAACGGDDDGPAEIPTSGAQVCAGVKDADRFRYTFIFDINSPKQAQSQPDPSPQGFALTPEAPDFHIGQRHTGAYQKPDRVDIEVLTPSQSGGPDSSFRNIRIGPNSYNEIAGQWQVDTSPNQGAFGFLPTNVCDVIVLPLDLSGATATPDVVGDREALRFSFSGAQLDAAAKLFGPQSDMGRLNKAYEVNLWLSEEKADLVKAEAVSRANYPFGREIAMTFTLEIGEYNEKGVEVEAPI